jgi:hypothetical protein
MDNEQFWVAEALASQRKGDLPPSRQGGTSRRQAEVAPPHGFFRSYRTLHISASPHLSFQISHSAMHHVGCMAARNPTWFRAQSAIHNNLVSPFHFQRLLGVIFSN